MIKLPLVDRLKFIVERQFVKGAGFQLLIVAAVIGLMALVGGIALRLGGAGESFFDAVWWAFLRMTDPGYLGDDEGAWRRIVSTVLTVSGYVVFLGALVAIMTQWLIARMREFERGLTPVAMRQHVVIVGWTNRTLPLLRELVGSERAREQFQSGFGIRRLRAVVLSENVSPAQAQALRVDSGLGRLARRVVLRFGSPLEEEAIHRAGCLNAAVVIMPTDFAGADSLVSADVATIRSLLSIDARAGRHGQEPPLVVAELQDIRRIDMARSAYRGPLEIVPSDDAISRLLTQNVLHPGLSAFYREVLTAREGNEILLRRAGNLAGATLKEATGQFPGAIVMGLVRKEDGEARARLNPPSSTRIDAGDKLVMLARSLADTLPAAAAGGRLPPIERGVPRRFGAQVGSKHRLLILGWNQRVPNLLDELASYGDRYFEVRLVSSSDIAMRREEIDRYSERAARVPVEHVRADFLLAGGLRAADLEGFTSVLLLASDRVASEEAADARTIVGHRVVEGLLAGRDKRPQILLELADAANEELARSAGVEAVTSPLVISHLLARIALQPAIRMIFDELFTVGGPEIEFRSPGYFGLSGDERFRDMEAAVAARGETLLGVRSGSDRKLALNPSRETHFLDGVQQLCVLTTVQASAH
ncbi:CASTOR/POLLUX-related putative ion channel [Wenzhouxiangella sediminis]|uniref:Ion channel DMI1 n=1 Tax=Wenzhouxiangella sediminis TaxID=1792836 RepID=A0A3E1KBQ3_9GAMM|nr:ion channel DMI1 [Wenzhouxiangella sediminis]RFF32003.1 ion channel DMI1 [Wenzhouxiangella sediminis]